MILLITPSQRGQECAAAIQAATNEPTKVTGGLRDAAADLRATEYSAVMIDQSALDAEPAESDVVLQQLGAAVPVYVNFAISGMERVIRELRTALSRRGREVMAARQAAEEAIRSDLKGTVTALLLSCEMALAVPDLSPAAESKIRAIHDLATELRTRICASG
jgi:hypothetical protein